MAQRGRSRNRRNTSRRSSSRRNVYLERWLEQLGGLAYAVVLVLIWRDGAEPRLLAVLAGAGLIYYLFFMPRVCRAVNSDRKSLCSNNARGLLGGCEKKRHQIENRWRFLPPGWRPASKIEVRNKRTGAVTVRTEVTESAALSFGDYIGIAEVTVSVLSLGVGLAAWLFPRV